MKILAIDDIDDNLIVLQAVVRDALPDCVVLTARNGPEGIALARVEDPDVILVDVVMPGMDGYAVCRQLKADEQSRGIPVVFLSGLANDCENRLSTSQAGAQGFLTKPVDAEALVAKIRAMAQLKTTNRLPQIPLVP